MKNTHFSLKKKVSNQAKRYQRGISLVEVMLSLSVIAVIIIMATRYYESTRTSQKINEAMTQINAIRNAAGQWRAGNPTYVDSSGNDMTFDSLKDRGFLPADFGKRGEAPTSPFGTEIELTLIGGLKYGYTVTFKAGKQECLAIKDRFANMDSTRIKPSCTDDDTVKIEFHN